MLPINTNGGAYARLWSGARGLLAVVAWGWGAPNSKTSKCSRTVDGGRAAGWVYVVDGGIAELAIIFLIFRHL